MHSPNLAALRRPPLEAAIVDLDGTMVDTLGDFEVALNRMLRELALPAITRDVIGTMVGKGSEHLIRSVLRRVREERDADGALFDQAWGRYVHHYLAINGQHAPIYAGVAEGLAMLRARGLRLACLTNKPIAFARPLLAAKGLDGYRASVRRRGLRTQEARSAAAPEDLRGARQCARPHADGRRFEQRRAGRARRRLPRGAGELWLQPRPAGARGGCRWLRRFACRARQPAGAGLTIVDSQIDEK